LWKVLDKNRDNKLIDWVTLYRQLKKETETTFEDWKARLEKKGTKLPGDLAKLKTQTTQAFYLPSRVGLFVTPQNDGLRIAEVWLETPAKRAGLRRGEIITAINGKDARTLKDYAQEKEAALKARPVKDLTLTVKGSDGRMRTVQVILAAPESEYDAK
jgi:S1-C subfamily serine protease